jgi:hypothetical protein
MIMVVVFISVQSIQKKTRAKVTKKIILENDLINTPLNTQLKLGVNENPISSGLYQAGFLHLIVA